jgi:hypothetical protein
MPVALQTGDLVNYDVHEATVEITDYDKCNALYYGRITDRMICAGNPSEVKGPCIVCGLQY